MSRSAAARAARTVLAGGTVFDSRGRGFHDADLAIEAGRIVAVETGLDGDLIHDVSGAALLPGLIDCHVYVTLSTTDVGELVATPFSYRCLQAAANLGLTLAVGVTTVRDAGGADLGIRRQAASVRRAPGSALD